MTIELDGGQRRVAVRSTRPTGLKGRSGRRLPKDGAEEFVGFVGRAALHELVKEAAGVGGGLRNKSRQVS
jgi:hypothetical protein